MRTSHPVGPKGTVMWCDDPEGRCRDPAHDLDAIADVARANREGGRADASACLRVERLATERCQPLHRAAPDLLAALEDFVTASEADCAFCDAVSWHGDGHGCRDVPFARAAIAKATGVV